MRSRRKRLADITVKVLKLKGREFFVFRWTDPVTSRVREKTSRIEAKLSLRRLAEREASKLEDTLEDELSNLADVTWTEFSKRYAMEHLSGLSKGARKQWHAAENHLVYSVRPVVLRDVTASALSKTVSVMRKKKVAETSIRSYLRALHAGLQWAVDFGLLEEMPHFPKISGSRGKTKHMRSRPITGEEFERLLDAVGKCRKKDVDLWKRFLNGLWFSGLRLGEALALSWDWHADFAIVLNGDKSVYRICAESEKGRKDRLLPVAPEFVEWLEREFPPAQRKGTVFKMPFAESTVSKRISDIGSNAGIIAGQNRTATAHDLRRSFGTRWAARLRPAELQVLMRHQSIETTMKYYVEINAHDLASELWKHVHKKSPNESLGEIPGGMLESAD